MDAYFFQLFLILIILLGKRTYFISIRNDPAEHEVRPRRDNKEEDTYEAMGVKELIQRSLNLIVKGLLVLRSIGKLKHFHIQQINSLKNLRLGGRNNLTNRPNRSNRDLRRIKYNGQVVSINLILNYLEDL